MFNCIGPKIDSCVYLKIKVIWPIRMEIYKQSWPQFLIFIFILPTALWFGIEKIATCWLRFLPPWTVFIWIASICLYNSFFFAFSFWLKYFSFCYYNSYFMVKSCWPWCYSFILLFSSSALAYNVLILQFNIERNLISEFLRPNWLLFSSNWHLLSEFSLSSIIIFIL